MPLAVAAAAAARTPSQFGCARPSSTSSYPHCSIGSSSAKRGTEAVGAKKKKTRRFSSSSIKPSSLHSNFHLPRIQIAPLAAKMESAPLYLGIDMGTSGGRAMVIDGESFFCFDNGLLDLLDLKLNLLSLVSSSSDSGTVVASAKKAYLPLSSSPDSPPPPRDWAETWARALDDLLEELSSSPPSLEASILPRVTSAAVAGTSASMLLVDAGGEGGEEEEEENEQGKKSAVGAPLAPVRLYCDAASAAAVEVTTALAPPGHQAAAPTSALSKLMDWWVSGTIEENNDSKEKGTALPVVVSAADWLTARLGRVGPKSSSSSSSSHASSSSSRSSGSSSSSSDGQFLRSRLLVTDDNNQLKAGWDPGAREYEPWLRGHPAAAHLAPRVLRPGDATGCNVVVEKKSGKSTYLPAGCLLAGGTTDSIAATLAAGVRSTPGDAVTSLGSSLAIKLVSDQRIDDGRRGIYSHLIPGDGEDKESVWLVGGSSNAGCAVFRSEFGPDDSVLERLTAEIEKKEEASSSTPTTTGLDYYPLPRKGERFPVCDPEKQPVLGPRPASEALHLKAILEGITAIEAAGFAALEELGAPKPTRVLTAGGGAKNAVWTRMRARALSPAVVTVAEEGEAAYGAALLARRAVTGKW